MITMQDLNKEKEQNKVLEKQLAGLHIEFIRKKRERFDFADTAHWIALSKKEEDFLMLCDKFTKWHNATKAEDPRRVELLDLLQSVWRLQSYCVNIETVIQASVAEYVTTEKRNIELASDKRKKELEYQLMENKYQKKIDELEKQIEWLNNNS